MYVVPVCSVSVVELSSLVYSLVLIFYHMYPIIDQLLSILFYGLEF